MQYNVEKGGCIQGENGIEVVATAVNTNCKLCSPLGYYYGAPIGEEVLMYDAAGEATVFGVINDKKLSPNEILISSPFGGYIRFSNNGDVIINGLVINQNGEVIKD